MAHLFQRKRNLLPLVFALIAPAPAVADDYIWTSTGSGTWSDDWHIPGQGFPNANDVNAIISLTGSANLDMAVDGHYTVNDLTVNTDAGNQHVHFVNPDDGDYSLTINGTLTKSENGNTLSFREMDVTVGTVDLTRGRISFGRNDGGRFVYNLTVTEGINMTNENFDAELRLNILNDYQLGLLTFGGSHAQDIYLINNNSSSSGRVRTATVSGISQAEGDNATIYGSLQTSGQLNEATLRIEAENDYTASTRLVDGTGGQLSLVMSGQGTQTLTGTSSYTGTTTISAGTLVIDGDHSAATGDVTVQAGGTLGGSGTIGGAVTVEDGGNYNAGNSAGVQTFTQGLALDAGSTFTWELMADSASDRGVNFDGVDIVGGSLAIVAGATSNLVFNADGSTVDFTSAFWQNGQSWLVVEGVSPAIVDSLDVFDTINVSQDSNGLDFSTTGGYFVWEVEGDDLYLHYIPEPGTLGLSGLGAMLLLRRMR
ncbi:PEP-CTERM sorting domain-containing protein [Phycisphaerales bacterium AB-hyl4]|uniref:PEP-CTERM sorting domain-containing protein n=1 Tax=Natronomicrosphaera hydrolytica TaxID=3242702 RepID=A0ABV4U2J6_9BACT